MLGEVPSRFKILEGALASLNFVKHTFQFELTLFIDLL